MKGTIVKCLEELLKTRFGESAWKAVLKDTGQENAVFVITTDVPDDKVLGLVKSAAKTLKITMEQAMEAFGEHWSTKYAPQLYSIYFQKAKNAREFLLNLDHVHSAMTKSMAGARPPHFTYEWRGDKHLVMKYQSARGLAALMPGLIRGVAKYYKERLSVSLQGNEVHVNFA